MRRRPFCGFICPSHVVETADIELPALTYGAKPSVSIELECFVAGRVATRQRAADPLCSSAHGDRTCHARTLSKSTKEKPVTLGTILLIVLVLMLVGALPSWPHSRSWGYGPSGGLGLVLVVVVLLLMGRI